MNPKTENEKTYFDGLRAEKAQKHEKEEVATSERLKALRKHSEAGRELSPRLQAALKITRNGR
jgi:hypothetical protein